MLHPLYVPSFLLLDINIWCILYQYTILKNRSCINIFSSVTLKMILPKFISFTFQIRQDKMFPIRLFKSSSIFIRSHFQIHFWIPTVLDEVLGCFPRFWPEKWRNRTSYYCKTWPLLCMSFLSSRIILIFECTIKHWESLIRPYRSRLFYSCHERLSRDIQTDAGLL
jgi:hypothetical protein